MITNASMAQWMQQVFTSYGARVRFPKESYETYAGKLGFADTRLET